MVQKRTKNKRWKWFKNTSDGDAWKKFSSRKKSRKGGLDHLIVFCEKRMVEGGKDGETKKLWDLLTL